MRDEFGSAVGSNMAWNSMLGEDVKNEELCKLLRRNHVVSRDEESLLGETINNDQYSGITGRRRRELLYEIHRDGVPRLLGNGKLFEESVRSVAHRFGMGTSSA